jgi:mannobiose 2-epimerase
LQPDGSMIYERWTDTGKTDTQRQWWVMCECIIGHINLYQHFGDRDALDKAIACWHFTRDHLVDWNNGEWHWSVDGNGHVNMDGDKAGFWKCPYHNSRMCLELIERDF